MKHVNYTCDLCGVQYKHWNHKHDLLKLSLINFDYNRNTSVYSYHRLDDAVAKEQDICENCQKKIYDFSKEIWKNREKNEN